MALRRGREQREEPGLVGWRRTVRFVHEGEEPRPESASVPPQADEVEAEPVDRPGGGGEVRGCVGGPEPPGEARLAQVAPGVLAEVPAFGQRGIRRGGERRRKDA